MALTQLLTGHDPSGKTRRWAAGLLAIPLSVVLLSGPNVVPSIALTPTDTTNVTAPVALPDREILTRKLKAVSTKGIEQKSIIVTTTDGQVLASRAANTPLTPASTMKVLTTMAAVDTLGADRTFATRTVDAGDGRVVVIGGGDPFLTDKASTTTYKLASLATLAVRTANALKTARPHHHLAAIRRQPVQRAAVQPEVEGEVAPLRGRVAALEINSGKLSNGRAATNPAKTAANALAKRLRAAGITVTSVAAGKAGATSTELARVTSASVSTIVKRTVLVSDNVAAETLLRQSAVAKGKPASFTGASDNLRDWLIENELWAPGQKIYDGSGLAPASKLTTATLAGAIRLALADATYRPRDRRAAGGR